MPLTGAHVQKALAAVGASGGQMKPVADLAAGANAALAQAPAGLTKDGAAAFLATMAQESAYFRTTTEYGTARKKYDPYRGRTFEQVTWRENYAAFGKWCKAKGLISDADYFVNNPTRLSDYQWAWLGGVWYFQHANLWRYANVGNFKAVSQGVNGGTGRIGTNFTPNGWAERQKMYQAFLLAGTALLPDGKTAPAKPSPTPQPAPAAKLAVDGVIGTSSTKALQRLAGTATDGVISGQPRSIRTTVTVSKTLDTCWPTIQYRATTGSRVIVWLQQRAGVKGDGHFGPQSRRAVQKMLGVKQDGTPGPATCKAMQRWINNGGK